MDTTTLNPGSRPRRGLLATIGTLAVLTAVVGVTLAGTPERAEAAELVAFASCGELEAWGAGAAGDAGSGIDESFADADGPVVAPEAGASGDAAPTATPGADRAQDANAAGDGDTGATNVAVDGVDELDLVDRLPGDRVLVASNDRLSLVDLEAGAVLATVEIARGARISHDPEAAVVWVVGPDGSADGERRGNAGTSVARIAVGEASLTPDGSWETSGRLVDARRVGDRLHLVAAEGFGGHDRPLPFADGPVACDEVLHPPVPSEPSATLLVTLPAVGAVEPVHATQVVGSGQLVHVTLDAAYLATPLHDGEPTTSIHRFDLAELTHTGSGRVEGWLLNDFAMSEHDGHLRVAVTTGNEFFVGDPIPADDVPVDIEASPVTPESIDPGPGVVEPQPDPGGARNEIVVLDIDGDLDEVGRTPRFGKPGESIHGIRFTGEVAYAVTFLTTDPFYVIDLADPAAPRIDGEVELPGFSAYLHPLSDTLVAGFGPDEAGRASVKLFDVTDRTAPRVVDDLALGDESPVVWDHHAYVDLGDATFAVPASTRGSVVESKVVVVDAAGGTLREVDRHRVATTESASRVLPTADGWAVLAGADLVLVDDTGAVRTTIELS